MLGQQILIFYVLVVAGDTGVGSWQTEARCTLFLLSFEAEIHIFDQMPSRITIAWRLKITCWSTIQEARFLA